MIDGSNDGRGDNGKTFIFNLIQQVMCQYVLKTKSSLLDKCNTTAHKQIIGLKGKRLIFMEEFPEKQLNPDLFKELSDGGIIENSIMFGTTEKINIVGMLFALSNHIPILSADETAAYNRYKQVSFCSHFDRTGDRKNDNPDKLEFIADTKLSDEILGSSIYRDELITLIVQYAMRFYTSGLPEIPSMFKRAQEETMKANDEVLDYVEQNYVITKDVDNVGISLEEMSDESGIPKDKLRKGMKRLNYVYNKDLCGLGKSWKTGKHYKGGYQDLKRIELED
jgi:phage/plasmid-associated DNA primase